MPPVLTTLGGLPEFLYTAEKSLATDLAQQIAWSKALEATPDEEIKCLTGRSNIEDLNDWQPLAIALSKLHQRLANDVWSFRSVAREVKSIKSFLPSELARWDALKSIQRRYYDILSEVDLWDKQAARNYAAAGLKLDEPEIRCRCNKKIVLVGTADMNLSVFEMLRQVSTQGDDHVSTLIAAPESLSDRFDEFGRLITEAWLGVPVHLDDTQIQIVDQPADQAYAVAYRLSQLSDETAADEITVGVPDSSVVPQVERSLNAIGLKHRHLAGRPLAETGPVRLMIACREYLRSQQYDSFASLIRHPDMHLWICEQLERESFIHQLDQHQNEYLPNAIRLDARLPFGDPALLAKNVDPNDPNSERFAKLASDSASVLNQVHGKIKELLSPLTGGEASISHWTRPWCNILVNVYGERLLDKNNLQDREILKACDAVYQALGNQQQVPEGFGTQTSAIQALDWAIEAAGETKVVPPPIPDAIELAGWLDLTLDDAPVMIITGMNDEHVPSSEIGHQFLPNNLCEKLGILDNKRRYARDAYALTVIASVRDNLLLIAGRRDVEGEPKKPSRLLFTESPENSAYRAKAFFSFEGKSEISRYWLAPEPPADRPQQFPIPLPDCVSPLTSLTVTSFKEYIKCPYRFYLQKFMKLREQADDLRELSASSFGDLTHNVLEAFGRSDAKDETNADRIREFLFGELSHQTKQRFSGTQLPAVRIQLEQLRRRLGQFAEHQAIRRQAGWAIVSTEESLNHELTVDGEPFFIRGKIDRVDQHEATRQVAVLDYKTSDAGTRPGPAHRTRNGWKDLQLPLYRHLLKEVAVVKGADYDNVQMGYVLLPKKLEEVGFEFTDWDAPTLMSADHLVFDIIRKIRKCIYWPPTDPPPEYSETLAAICQDRVFERYPVEVGQ